MDIILGCIKQMDKIGIFNNYFKVILASATINEHVFQEFFNNCQVLRIAGTTHPIIDCFKPPRENEDIIDKVVQTVEEILLEK